MPGPGAVSLGDAVAQFLAREHSRNTPAFQQELQKLLRWYGRDRHLKELSPWDVESFGQSSGADSLAKLAPVKAFLAYAYREGLTPTNLASHLKVKRAPARKPKVRQAPPVIAQLSQEGHRRIQGQLEALKAQRLRVAEEIRRAMADKDFRENAPLDAAREQQAHHEARIRELEQTLGHAQIMADEEVPAVDTRKSMLGRPVVVQDLETGEQTTYILVDPREVDLAKGKISVESPAGRAFLHRAPGETVEVAAPGGALRYRIERVER